MPTNSEALTRALQLSGVNVTPLEAQAALLRLKDDGYVLERRPRGGRGGQTFHTQPASGDGGAAPMTKGEGGSGGDGKRGAGSPQEGPGRV